MKLKNTFILLIAGTLYSYSIPKGIAPSLLLSTLSFLCSLVGMLLYFFIIQQNKDIRTNIISYLFFSIPLSLVGMNWMSFTIKEYGFIGFPFNYFLNTLYSPFVVPQLLLMTLLFFYAQQKKKLLLHPSLLAFFFVLFEEFTPTLWPFHQGHFFLNLSSNPPFASFLGSTGYSFISYFVILTFIIPSSKKLKSLGLFLLCSSIFLPLSQKKYSPKDLKEINIRLVQGNVGNYLKINSEKGDSLSLHQVIKRHEILSQDKSDNIHLLIWPETAYPYTIHSQELRRHKTSLTGKILQNIAIENNLFFLTGGYDYIENKNSSSTPGFEDIYNSAFYFDSKGEFQDVYHKHLLLPFGETLPFGPLNFYLSKIITNVSFFARGNSFQQFHLKEHQISFAVSICYEILFHRFVRHNLAHFEHQTDFLVNITNDSWFGDSREPYQHLFLAKWRAIEFNIPIVRSTNTGISTIIKADGSMEKTSNLFKEEKMDYTLKVPFTREKTFYEKYDFLGTFILAIFLLLLEFFLRTILASRDREDG